MTRTRLPHLALLLAVGLVMLLASCSEDAQDAPSDPVGFVGSDGVAVEDPDTARIVTLSGDLTELVFELGLGGSIVATDVTTVAPEEAVGLPKAGIGRFLTAEGVLKHEPTLVIGDAQTSPLSTIEQIRSAGVPVAILAVPTTFEGLYDKVTALGTLLDRPAEAGTLRDRLRLEIEEAHDAAIVLQPQPRVAYVYTRGPDVMLLFGEGMTTTPVIEAARALDAGVDGGVEGTITVTPEALAAAAPDVLIVPSEGLEALGGVDGLLAIPGIAATPAGVAGWVLDYPEGDFLTFGPRIAKSITLLAEDLSLLLGHS
ncbi:MAG: ABC transporter substrate-binding protein [Actinomycetota bacterium]